VAIIPGIFGGGTAIGSAGGVTFQRHPAGNLARAKVIPANPNTTPQQEVRAIWTEIMDRWRTTLTNAQRESWQQYADGAKTRSRRQMAHFISGRQAYIRANMPIRRALLPFVDTPPITPGLALPAVFTITADSTNGIRITAINPPLSADQILQTRRSSQFFQTRNYYRSPWFETTFWDSTDILPFELVPSVVVGFPERYWINLYIIHKSNGRQTIPQKIQVDSNA
jgi:hypothetical protein